MASSPKLAGLLLRAVQEAELRAGDPVPPPRNRRERAVAAAAHTGFRICLALTAAFVFGLLAASQARWLAWTELGFGLFLLAEGLLLVRDWLGARRLLLWRLRGREPAHAHAQLPLSRRLVRRLASPGLRLLGAVWMAAGGFAMALALARLV